MRCKTAASRGRRRAWKRKLKRYFVSTALVFRELLKWAESHDTFEIREAKIILEASARITEEQALNVNAQIWGSCQGDYTTPQM